MEYNNADRRSKVRMALTNPKTITLAPNFGRNLTSSNGGPGTSTPGGQPEYKVNIPVDAIPTKRVESGVVNSTVTSGLVTITFDTPFKSAPIVTGMVPVKATADTLIVTNLVVSTTGIEGTLLDVVADAPFANVTPIHWSVMEA
jgi:hypothetical protein